MRIQKLWVGILALAAVLIILSITIRDPEENQQGETGPEKDGPVKTAPTEAEILATGKKAWRSCATCHCTTDERIAQDRDWVLLNEETTWIEAGKPAPELRKAIISYLFHPQTLKPVLVDQNYKPGEGAKAGEVIVPAISGSAHLKADRESVKEGSPSMVRLYWPETGDEKSMAAPTGAYKVINYWMYRKGAGDAEERWMATVTNVDGCAELYIDEGEEAYFGLDTVLYNEFTAAHKDGVFKLSFFLHDRDRNRMTLSKNGRVIMPSYRIVDGAGKILAEGKFNIIWGSFTADWGPGPEEVEGKMRAELIFDNGPFRIDGDKAIDLEKG